MNAAKPHIPTWLDKSNPVLFLFFLWLTSVGFSLLIHRDRIAPLAFWDPDDSMRLVQVRDFLAGQSWFDVSQHRANPPVGGPMHWSRLIDLPIAAFIFLLRPLVGPHSAEIGAVLLVPAVTLAAMLGATYWAVRALMGKPGALLACVALVASPTVFIQFPEMRIDHHAWQIVMAAFALVGIFHPDRLKGGAIAGLAMATWILISIEGLPFAVLAAATMAFHYVLRREEWPRLWSYAWTLACASLVLFFTTHRWQEIGMEYCDAISSAYLAPLSAAPLLVTVTHRILGAQTAGRRVLQLCVAGSTASAIFAASGRACLAGPFSALDPMVYQFWHEAVHEGLPIWKQGRPWIGFVLFSSLISITGTVLAILRQRDQSRKIDWLRVLIMSIGATVLGCLVFRTIFVAYVFGLPGTIYLVMELFKRARRLSALALRVPATAISLLLLFPMTTAGAMVGFLAENQNANPGRSNGVVLDNSEIAALDAVAPATICAPIDIGPDILRLTRNSVIGTGHHRNAQGMKIVISTLLAPPPEARAILLKTPASYLLIKLTGETDRYKRKAPHGLAAQLLDDKPPAWLVPVQVPGLKALRLYRIDRTGS